MAVELLANVCTMLLMIWAFEKLTDPCLPEKYRAIVAECSQAHGDHGKQLFGSHLKFLKSMLLKGNVNALVLWLLNSKHVSRLPMYQMDGSGAMKYHCCSSVRGGNEIAANWAPGCNLTSSTRLGGFL